MDKLLPIRRCPLCKAEMEVFVETFTSASALSSDVSIRCSVVHRHADDACLLEEVKVSGRYKSFTDLTIAPKTFPLSELLAQITNLANNAIKEWNRRVNRYDTREEQ